MADDGSGVDITIPSFLIFKADSNIIKDELIANRPVQMILSWNIPSPDHIVTYDLWMTPSDLSSRDFFQSFKMIAQSLGNRAHFTPHMYISDGIRSKCQNLLHERCSNLCTNNGRYCSMEQGSDLQLHVSGTDVVHESLRRLCIWSIYGSVNGIGVEWWDYVASFNEQCAVHPERFTDPNCIHSVYKAAKINGLSIEQCMIDSGGTTNDISNSKLESELVAISQQGVVVVPTVYVDNAPIRDELSVNNVLSTI